MAKFLIQFSYTKSGIEGLSKEGGSSRQAAVEKLATSLGGKLESFYFSFGEYDGFLIVEFPDNLGAAAAGLIASGAGGAHTMTTVLMSAAEMDEVTKRHGLYRAPGQ